MFSIFQRITRSDNSPESVARRTTNDDIFGPSTEDLQRLMVQLRQPKSGQKVLHVMEQRLQSSSRHWRRKSKTLSVLQYFLVSGNPAIIEWIQHHIKLLEVLVSYQYVDSRNKDQGKSVREKAASILSLVNDPQRLSEAKEKFELQRQGVRTSIGAGRPSTASRTTLEAIRDNILDDEDDLETTFRAQSPSPGAPVLGLRAIQEER